MTAGRNADRNAHLTGALAPYLDRGAGEAAVLLAVSGGPDSTALLHAAARFAAIRPLFVATVDHRLRPESAAEASAVAEFAANLGVPHRVLVWRHSDPSSGIQAAARQARYELLVQHAAEVGAALILTAHHADDQAETVLMRILAGSGPAGLAGMARERELADGVRLARPFLGLTKAELVAYCRDHALHFADDPSNRNDRYARGHLRSVLPVLAREGLTAERLRRLAARSARDEAALAKAADALLEAVKLPSGPDEVRLAGSHLRSEPEALVLRVIDRALDLVPAGKDAAFKRLERLERLVLDSLLPALARGEGLRRTLRGILVAVQADGVIRLSRAPPRRGGSHVAGPPDLLGKGEGCAYIGRERVE